MIGYFCPKCAGPEVSVQTPLVVDPGKANGGATAKCELCSWSGEAAELIGAICPANESWWTVDRVGHALLFTIGRSGSGPILNVLCQLGLVPKDDNDEAAEIRNQVMRDIMAATIGAAITSAATHAGPYFAQRNDQAVASVMNRLVSE